MTTLKIVWSLRTTAEMSLKTTKIIVWFGITFLHTNIQISDMLNINKDYVNKDDQFLRKTAISQDKFYDPFNQF